MDKLDRIEILLVRVLEKLEEKPQNLTETKENTVLDRVKKLYTRQEVSEMLNVTIQTIISWDKKRILNPIRIGRQIRYRKTDIDKLVNEKGDSSKND